MSRKSKSIMKTKPAVAGITAEPVPAGMHMKSEILPLTFRFAYTKCGGQSGKPVIATWGCNMRYPVTAIALHNEADKEIKKLPFYSTVRNLEFVMVIADSCFAHPPKHTRRIRIGSEDKRAFHLVSDCAGPIELKRESEILFVLAENLRVATYLLIETSQSVELVTSVSIRPLVDPYERLYTDVATYLNQHYTGFPKKKKIVLSTAVGSLDRPAFIPLLDGGYFDNRDLFVQECILVYEPSMRRKQKHLVSETGPYFVNRAACLSYLNKRINSMINDAINLNAVGVFLDYHSHITKKLCTDFKDRLQVINEQQQKMCPPGSMQKFFDDGINYLVANCGNVFSRDPEDVRKSPRGLLPHEQKKVRHANITRAFYTREHEPNTIYWNFLIHMVCVQATELDYVIWRIPPSAYWIFDEIYDEKMWPRIKELNNKMKTPAGHAPFMPHSYYKKRLAAEHQLVCPQGAQARALVNKVYRINMAELITRMTFLTHPMSMAIYWESLTLHYKKILCRMTPEYLIWLCGGRHAFVTLAEFVVRSQCVALPADVNCFLVDQCALEKQFVLMCNKLAAGDEQNKHLVQELADVNALKTTLHELTIRLHNEIDELKSSLSSERALVASLRADVRVRDESMNEWKTTALAAQKRIKMEADKHSEDVRKFTIELQTQKAENRKLQARVESTEKKEQKEIANNLALSHQLEVAQARMASLESKFAVAPDDAELRAKVTTYEKERLFYAGDEATLAGVCVCVCVCVCVMFFFVAMKDEELEEAHRKLRRLEDLIVQQQAERRVAKRLEETRAKESKQQTLQEHGHVLCKVCFERPVNAKPQECIHANFCMECLKRVKECPICRTKIVKPLQAVSVG